MKPIQVLFDERLLGALDADEEVRKHGRSAVLRRAAADYLRRSRSQRIAEQYRQAYSGAAQVSEEVEGWASDGVWPEE